MSNTVEPAMLFFCVGQLLGGNWVFLWLKSHRCLSTTPALHKKKKVLVGFELKFPIFKAGMVFGLIYSST